jgi:putative transcriptional regulator
MSILDWLNRKGDEPSDDGGELESMIIAPSAALGIFSSFPTIELSQLTGKCLIASPFMDDRRFKRSVVFICGHTETGAMGLIINNTLDEPDFSDLLRQFNIEPDEDTPDLTIVAGGPVDSMRGFVLHSLDYKDVGTQIIDEDLGLSSSLDVLKAMAKGEGPKQAMLALGYTGWDEGQLEREMSEHAWLVTDADRDLLFEISCNHRWDAALSRLGVQPASISQLSGRA